MIGGGVLSVSGRQSHHPSVGDRPWASVGGEFRGQKTAPEPPEKSSWAPVSIGHHSESKSQDRHYMSDNGMNL